MLRRITAVAAVVLLCGCVSYYESYESDYYAGSYGSYYNAPLRLRGLEYNDFYMMDNYPHDYFNMQLWSALSDLSRFSIVTLSRGLTR